VSSSSLQDTVLPGFSLFEVFRRASPVSTASEKSELSLPFGLTRPREASQSYTLTDMSASRLEKASAMEERYRVCRMVWPFCVWVSMLGGLRGRCV